MYYAAELTPIQHTAFPTRTTLPSSTSILGLCCELYCMLSWFFLYIYKRSAQKCITYSDTHVCLSHMLCVYTPAAAIPGAACWHNASLAVYIASWVCTPCLACPPDRLSVYSLFWSKAINVTHMYCSIVTIYTIALAHLLAVFPASIRLDCKLKELKNLSQGSLAITAAGQDFSIYIDCMCSRMFYSQWLVAYFE